ncbi:MAG: tetratricopeptide repeat protein [Cellvibrionaceae bacterium]
MNKEKIIDKRVIIDRRFILYLAIAAAIVGLSFFFYLSEPLLYVHAIFEDSVIEYLTSTLYFSSSALLLVFIYSRKSRSFGYYLLLVCFLFMALEEISWGQRIFGLSTPESLAKVNFQKELNIHNVIDINPHLKTLGVLVLLWSAFSSLLLKIQLFRRIDESIGIPFPFLNQLPIFLVVAIFLHQRPFLYGTELSEFILSVVFFFYVVELLIYAEIKWFKKTVISASFAIFLAVFLSYFFPGGKSPEIDDRWMRESRLAKNYAKSRLCTQAEVMYRQILKTRNDRNNIRFPIHEANLNFTRLLSFTGRENEAQQLLEQYLEKYLASASSPLTGADMEKLGDIYLHLKKKELAKQYYRNALNTHLEQLPPAKGEVWKYAVYYLKPIRLATKMEDFSAAESYSQKIKGLSLNKYQEKRVKKGIKEFNRVLEIGYYPTELVTLERKDWGKFGLDPVGTCKPYEYILFPRAGLTPDVTVSL